jgi:hypothetical protein
MIKKIVVRKKKQRKIQYNYSYQAALAASKRIGWKVDDIIGGERISTSQNRSCTESLTKMTKIRKTESIKKVSPWKLYTTCARGRLFVISYEQ